VPGDRAVDIFELAHHPVLEERLRIIRQNRAEHRPEILVQFGGDEVEPFLQLVTFRRTVRRREIFSGSFVGNHLDDHRAFRQNFAVVHHQRRHLPLGIDLGEVVAAFSLLCLEVNFDQFVRKAGFMKRDMGRERTGAGRVIKLHGKFLPAGYVFKSRRLNAYA